MDQERIRGSEDDLKPPWISSLDTKGKPVRKPLDVPNRIGSRSHIPHASRFCKQRPKEQEDGTFNVASSAPRKGLHLPPLAAVSLHREAASCAGIWPSRVAYLGRRLMA
jgi:hypothetical protein